MLVAINTFSTR